MIRPPLQGEELRTQQLMKMLRARIVAHCPHLFNLDERIKTPDELNGFSISFDDSMSSPCLTIYKNSTEWEIKVTWSSSQRNIVEAVAELSLIQRAVFFAAELQVWMNKYFSLKGKK